MSFVTKSLILLPIRFYLITGRGIDLSFYIKVSNHSSP